MHRQELTSLLCLQNIGWLRSWFRSTASQPDTSTSYDSGAHLPTNSTILFKKRSGQWSVVISSSCHISQLQCAAGVGENEEADGSTGTAAWKLLGSEAWRLLDGGHLRCAARLSAALSAVGGSMPALLLSCRPPDRPPPSPQAIVRGAVSCSCLEIKTCDSSGSGEASCCSAAGGNTIVGSSCSQ